MHFIDLNKTEQPFNLVYSKQLRGVEEALKNMSYLEEQCARMKVELKWPENLSEFNASMKKLTSTKSQSEQMLYDGIVSDIYSNTVFVKNQFS